MAYFVVVFLLLLPQVSYAYLDPGSGSVLVSVIVALLAAAFYFLKSFFYEKLRFLFKKQSPVHKEDYDLVFYSEGGQYWNVFLPVLRELDRRGQRVVYLTSGSQDPGLSSGLEHVEAMDIGEGHQAYYVLNRLSAGVLVMTTPGLDVLQIKRSKKVGHYCHIVHGLEDTSTYPPYGVDYYDSVLVNGQHQQEVIRTLERQRGAKEKQVEIIGSTYLDIMLEELEAPSTDTLSVQAGRQTVLLAPSWGEKGFLGKFGGELLEKILQEDLNVILRPHPQSYTAEADLLKELKKRFSGSDKLVWDENPSGLEAMQKSDIMISDFSGIIFDYIFLFEKPVIVTDFKVDPRKFDMNGLPEKQSTLMGLIKEDKIGYQLKEDEHRRIGAVVKQVLQDNRYAGSIEDLKKRVWLYPRESGKRGADFIEKILKDVRR